MVIARDPLGVCPLYWGHDADGRLWVASEMKAIVRVCADVAVFPPGHWYDSATGELVRFHARAWREYEATQGVEVSPPQLREALEAAVHRQLMSDVPYGVLLSGGLDSSIVAACAALHARRRVEDDDRSEAWWPRLHSFAIGLADSPDLAAAQVAADAIGTVHHGFTYTLEEGLDVLPDVIRHVETYDVTTIRASTPMFLLARRIKAMGVKMVLSGEGADEIFGGYLYFHKAPDAREFHAETVRKLDALHQFDCARANKAMMAWGVEARVPFLDLAFLDVAMAMDAEAKCVRMRGGRTIEKAVLREAFEGVLPDAILWRQKEQFSDGVGYGWIDGLKALRGARSERRGVRDGGGAVSDQHAGDEGSVPVSPMVRSASSPAMRRRARYRAANRSRVRRPRRSRGMRVSRRVPILPAARCGKCTPPPRPWRTTRRRRHEHQKR